jgi:hypothetical protein
MQAICEFVPNAKAGLVCRSREECPALEAGRPIAVVFGIVDYDHVAAFPDLKGKMIRCAHGNLWVTLENIPGDYSLAPGESLLVPALGKVIIGGKGSYTIEHGIVPRPWPEGGSSAEFPMP